MGHPLRVPGLAVPDDGADETNPRVRLAWSAHRAATAFDISPDLVEQLRARDEAAYAKLFAIAFAPLAHFAYGYLESHEAAEDVVQDVICRIWHQGAAWVPNGSARTYLYAAVRNAAITALRRQRVAGRHVDAERAAAAASPDLVATPSAEADVALAVHLRHALASLTDRQRAAFELRYARDLTVPEIATVLGVSTKAAEKLVARTLCTLREKLRHLRG